jgi:hypothetical protein
LESFSLTYLNPPYDFDIGEQKSQRMEKLFLEHVHRWLTRGGTLVFVVPSKRIADCAAMLSDGPGLAVASQAATLGVRPAPSYRQKPLAKRCKVRDNQNVRNF